jgi:hypothetical protein
MYLFWPLKSRDIPFSLKSGIGHAPPDVQKSSAAQDPPWQEDPDQFGSLEPGYREKVTPAFQFLEVSFSFLSIYQNNYL